MRHWINWVLHPIKCSKEINNEFEEKEKIKLQNKKNEVQTKLNKEREIMLNSLCAINNGMKCFPECTHFDKGVIEKWEYPMGTINYDYYSPKCKLWK